MKTKGISFFEQHVEKIVLGVSGVVFVSVLVWQLFPTTVKVDGKNVALGDLDREIATKTEMLKRKLDTENTPLAEQLKGKLPQSLNGSAFEALAASHKLGSDALPQIEPRLAKGKIEPVGGADTAIFHVPVFAAAKMGATIQVDDTVEESFLQQNPKAKELPALSGASADVSWLVPNATIDAKAMFAELAKEEPKAIPTPWYRSNLFLVDVVFERQEVLGDNTAGVTGQVEILPGAFTLRQEILRDQNAALRDGVWDALSNASTQRSILQPEFIPTKRGNFSAATLLSDPDEVEEGEDPKLRSLRKNVAKQSLEVARLEQDLKELGGPLEDTSKEDKKREEEEEKESGGGNRGGSGNSGQNRPGGGLGGGGLSGGMGGGKNNGSGADPRDEATKEKRIKMTKALKEKKARLESLQKELEKLGASVESSKATGPFDPKSQERLVVWAHDLGVVPGRTYRYRAALRTYNPFFTYAGLLDKEQKPLATPFTIDTPIAEWSEPLTVAPRIAFFVTDAVPGEGRLGVGQASVEVYTYQDGERRVERVTIQPGDAISGKDSTTGTGYFLVDVVADPTTDRGGSDRRASAIAIIQAESGKRYEIKVPSAEVRNDRRLNLQDEVELAKAEAEQESDGGDGGSKAGEGAQSPPPRGPSGT